MAIAPINNTDKHDIMLKAGVTATTAMAVGGALAHIAKRQGFSVSPSALKKTPIKDWAIFRLYDEKNPNKKELVIEGKEILELATASVIGGLTGGLIFDDKKHTKAKLRESVNQLLGNVLVPVGCVWGISQVYKKYKPQIMDKIPQIKETGNISRYFNKALKGLPFYGATLFALVTGVFTGNKVSNLLNEKVFHKKVEREVKGSDFAPHVDDIGMAVSLMAEKSKTASFIQRIVPLFLCVPGYQVGTHKVDF